MKHCDVCKNNPRDINLPNNTKNYQKNWGKNNLDRIFCKVCHSPFEGKIVEEHQNSRTHIRREKNESSTLNI